MEKKWEGEKEVGDKRERSEQQGKMEARKRCEIVEKTTTRRG